MNLQELEKRNKTLEKRWKILLVLAVLFFITRPVALYVVNHFIHKAAKDATTNRYPMIDPARQFVDPRDYIINIQPLRARLFDIIQNQNDFTATVYFEYLHTGASISINTDLRLWPASLTKLPLGMAVMKKIENGKLNYTDKLILMPEDIDPLSGSLHKAELGSEVSVKNLLDALLIDSDNTAENMLQRSMSSDDLNLVINEIGLDQLFTKEGKITSKEYTRLFRALYTSSFLKPENTQKLLDLLNNSSFRGFAGEALPTGVKFAHKWGENDPLGIYADSGIVYAADRPYMITIIVEAKSKNLNQNRTKAADLIGKISRGAYDYIIEVEHNE